MRSLDPSALDQQNTIHWSTRTVNGYSQENRIYRGRARIFDVFYEGGVGVFYRGNGDDDFSTIADRAFLKGEMVMMIFSRSLIVHF